MSQLFDFIDYRKYLAKVFSGTGESRGGRLKLAEYLNCQASFLTQIFSEKAHLSLEHAIRTSQYLSFSTEENDYFMLLVQKAKAGSKELEGYFENKIKSIKAERDQIKTRIKVQTNLSLEDEMRYYGVWYHSAIHILVSIPGFQTTDAITKKLKLDLLTVKSALQFLSEKGFIKTMAGIYSIGPTRIHLKKGSAMLPRHHANWRMKAIESVDREKLEDLHYTAVLGIAKNDLKIFREKMLKLLEEFEPIVTASQQDSQVILLLDLFET